MTSSQEEQFHTSHNIILRAADAESKNDVMQVILWAMTELKAILFPDGKFKKPGLFKYARLVAFTIQLANKMADAIGKKDRKERITPGYLTRRGDASFDKIARPKEPPRDRLF